MHSARWESTSRYYLAQLSQDLLGDWVLTLAWGGLRSRRGRVVTRVVSGTSDAETALAALHRRRTCRGYGRVQ